MNNRLNRLTYSTDYLGCFGNFSIEDRICLRLCVLSMRCAIEKDQNTHLELLDELLASESVHEIIQ